MQPPETATTVRVQDGETLITDGPFAEIKEAIGGYCLFEAEDLDAAIEFELAEESAQDAFAIAAERWPRNGARAHPGAWLLSTGRNRAIDRIRRDRTLAVKTPLLEVRSPRPRVPGRDSPSTSTVWRAHPRGLRSRVDEAGGS